MFRLFIFIILFTNGFSCTQKQSCLPINTILNLTVNTENLKDTLPLNDTIWISLELPKFVEDAHSEQNLELIGNLSEEFVLSLYSITEFTPTPSTGNFKFIADLGKVQSSSSDNLPYFEFEDCNNLSKIRFGLVPIVEGTYLVSFGVLLFEPNLSLRRVGTDCSRVISDFTFTTNSDSENNNYHIVTEGAVPEYLPPFYTLEDFEHDGSFAIVVNE